MEQKILKVNKNKSGSGSISSRVILPSSWVKDLEIENEVVACYDKDSKRIIIEKRKGRY